MKFIIGALRAPSFVPRNLSSNVQLWTRRLDSLLKLTWDVAALGIGGKFHVVLAVHSE